MAKRSKLYPLKLKKDESIAISDKLLDELLKDYPPPEDLLGQNGIMRELKKRLIERAQEAEISYHLGYRKYAPERRNRGNSRNGHNPCRGCGKRFAVTEISDILITRLYEQKCHLHKITYTA